MKKFWQQRWLWLIIIFAFLLRLPLLNGSFWLDEAAQALESVRPFAQQLQIVPDFQPPLMHYLVHFAAQLSIVEWWLRLWGALIPGLITIWLTYELGKKLWSKQVGLVASLLLATSSLHIFYSQELRPYSLPAMWGMISTWLLFKKDWQWWQFGLASLAGLYSSYLYPFLLIPQLWLVWRRHGRAALVKSLALAGALFAPWLPMFFRQLAAGQQLRIALPNWETAVSLPQAKALVLVPLKFVYGLLNVEPTAFFMLTLGLLAIALVLSWRPLLKQKFWQWENDALQLLLLFVSPLILSWLVSFAVPIVRPKRLLYLLPFFYLLTALPLAKKKINWRLAILPALILAGINLYSTASYWTNPHLQREDWRSLKQEILVKFPAEDTIAVFAFNEAFSPWRWYQPAAIPSLSINQGGLKNSGQLAAQLEIITNYRYVLVFDYLRDLTDPNRVLEPAIESYGFTGRGVIDYPNIGFVRIYSQREFAIGLRP